MRWLLYLAAITLAFAGAIAGPLWFSVQTPAQPPCTAQPGELAWCSGSMTIRLTDRPCDIPELALDLESRGIPPARIYVEQVGQHRRLGCWARDIDQDILTVSSGGQDGFIAQEWITKPR